MLFKITSTALSGCAEKLSITERCYYRREIWDNFFSLQSNMTIAAHYLKLNEMEQALTESAQMKRVLLDCYWLVSWATCSQSLTDM